MLTYSTGNLLVYRDIRFNVRMDTPVAVFYTEGQAKPAKILHTGQTTFTLKVEATDVEKAEAYAATQADPTLTEHTKE